MPRARASVVGLRTDKGENSENPDRCKFRKHDDVMRMMTWQDATRKQMTKQQQRITGGQLAHRIWGVTTTPLRRYHMNILTFSGIFAFQIFLLLLSGTSEWLSA